MFTWKPIYKELAKALLAYRNRQPELVSFLDEIKQTNIPMVRLIDAPNPATEPKLSTIDPFTFFASFNRGLTDQNRIGILKVLKNKLHLVSEIPTDFPAAGLFLISDQSPSPSLTGKRIARNPENADLVNPCRPADLFASCCHAQRANFTSQAQWSLHAQRARLA